MQRGIVFDGDDTLWQTESLYDDARDQARQIVETAGVDGARWEDLERQIDVENVERLGHSMARFPTSCVEAYERVCAETGHDVDLVVRAGVEAAAQSVFQQRPPPVEHATKTLAALRSQGFRLALLTKGDPAVQQRRVEQSGLESMFDLVEIVDRKTPEAISSVLDRLDVAPADALSVGNSVRSDVLPALAAGVTPVWIDAHVWEYERLHDPLEDGRVIQVESMSDMLEVVASWAEAVAQ